MKRAAKSRTLVTSCSARRQVSCLLYKRCLSHSTGQSPRLSRLPSRPLTLPMRGGSRDFPCNVDHRVQHLRSRLPPPTTIISNNNNIITPVIKRHMAPECVPSATVSCEQNLASSTTDMGSAVIAMPKNVVLPSTVYQGHVQSKEAQVYAAEAQHTSLKQSNVNLGSNVLIQPVTKVIPQTTYQPSVDQKATVVEMAVPENESLARSSVTLGSTVTVRPVTTIEPLTIYQPKVVSLPFIIHEETGCEMHVIPKAKDCESLYC